MASSPQGSEPPETYWYDASDSAVEVLRALRRFRAADQAMRRAMGADMDLNATNLLALRHVIAGELAGEPVTPLALARLLEISTASTTKLLDRLTSTHHVRRVPHQSDRRSMVVLATETAHAHVRRHLAAMHDGMLAVAQALPPEHRVAVADFLVAMAEQLEGPGTDEVD